MSLATLDANQSIMTSFDDATGALKVKSASSSVSATPTISTAPAYTSGDQLGGLQTLASVFREAGGFAVLESINLVDQGKQSSEMDIFFFNAAPTIASTDNAAANISDAEMAAKCIGVATILSTDYKTLTVNSTACVKNIGLSLKTGSATTSLFALAVVRGTPTYASTSDLVFTYNFFQD